MPAAQEPQRPQHVVKIIFRCGRGKGAAAASSTVFRNRPSSLFSAAFRAYQNGHPDWPERGGKKEGGSFPFPHLKKSLSRISSCVGFPFPRPKKGIFLYFPFFSPVTLDISSFLLLPHPRFNNRKEELDWKPRPARREPSRPKRVFPRVTIDDRRHGWKRKEMTERKEEERGWGSDVSVAHDTPPPAI